MSLLRRRMMLSNVEEGEEVREWKLLADVTLEESVDNIDIEVDANGNPFSVTELLIYGDSVAFEDNSKYWGTRVGEGYKYGLNYGGPIRNTNRAFRIHQELICGKLMDMGSTHGASEFSQSFLGPYGSLTGVDTGIETIERLRICCTIGNIGALTAGSRYIVYGR